MADRSRAPGNPSGKGRSSRNDRVAHVAIPQIPHVFRVVLPNEGDHAGEKFLISKPREVRGVRADVRREIREFLPMPVCHQSRHFEP